VDQETLIKKVKPYTLVHPQKLKKLIELVTPYEKVRGSMAEVGVFKGGTALILNHLKPESNLYLFDTFEGLPQPSNLDGQHKKGSFKADMNGVKALFAGKPNVKIYKGYFPDSIPVGFSRRRFSVVHIDVDIYVSVMDCLQYFYSKMVKGGIMILDDYTAISCPGAKKAADDFCADKREKVQIISNDGWPANVSHGVIVKE
jgi:hypothetical protein